MKKFLIVIVVLAILAVLFINKKDEYVSLVEEDNAVAVADQLPGEDVVVNYVKLNKPGYVSVYSDVGGVKTLMGRSYLLPAGEHKDVKVKLNTVIRSGGRAKVYVQEDNGDGVFGEEDINVLDENGEEVVSEFDVSDDAPNTEDVIVEDLVSDEGYTINEDNDFNDPDNSEDSGEMMEEDTQSDDSSIEIEESGDIEGETSATEQMENTDTEEGSMSDSSETEEVVEEENN